VSANLKRSGVLLALAVALLALPVAAQAEFGIKALSTTALEKNGSTDLQAGSHPYEFNLSFTMNQIETAAPESEWKPDGTLRDLIVDLPAGFVGNPRAAHLCPTSEFEGQNSLCPGASQVGVAYIHLAGIEEPAIQPVFNLTPPLGVAARLGFSLTSLNTFEEASLNPANNYGARISDFTVPSIPGTIEIQSVKQVVWGVPADPEHDAERQCVKEGKIVNGCPTDGPEVPFISLPTSCGSIPTTVMQVDSLEEPGKFKVKEASFLNEEGKPAHLRDCEALPFAPKFTAAPETNVADSPTGLHVGVEVPQNEAPKQRATAHLKDVSVTFPAGLAVNPSAADGLAACPLSGPDGINLPKSGPEEGQPAHCPAASKVGTVEVKTPLLDHTVPGSVYLARQGENPFGSLIALYIALNDPISGVVAKIAGKVEPDPLTGQLVGSFENNPQLPFEELSFDFFGGSRASLTTPFACGTYTTNATMTPWSAPEGKAVPSQSSFQIAAAPGGGSCAPSEAAAPNAPAFEAGTQTPLAGSYSPLRFKIARENGSQRIGAIDATLPPGLTGRLAGLTECSDAQLAQAASRNQPGQGALERQSPSCPATSEIGTVTVGAGSGAPFYVQGHAYLTGPYKGAPLSFAFITPAIAGPFDLGAVVVRAPAYVDPTTAQITVKSDPIPKILDGIPLDLRSIAVNADRDRFTLNPTSCDPMTIGGQAISTLGQSAALSNRFQASGCRGLGFKPRFSLRLKGGTKRAANPKLIATLAPREGDANISALSVKLPRSAFLDQSHIRTVCTRVQFAADACPPGSVYGKVSVQTPILGYPLTGNVYLRSSSHKLPDLVADLRGPSYQPIRIQLSGRTDSVKGALRNSFDFLPDAPFSTARLELFGGKRGLVVNSRDLCKHEYRATAKLEAHSGAGYEAQSLVGNDCAKGREGKGGRRPGARG
jgi:hypothetical protein